MHIDEFVEWGSNGITRTAPPGEDYARFVMCQWRLPAHMKMSFDSVLKKFELYCTYKDQRYRVVMASRLGDIGLSLNYTECNGYSIRVDPEQCSKWGATLEENK